MSELETYGLAGRKEQPKDTAGLPKKRGNPLFGTVYKGVQAKKPRPQLKPLDTDRLFESIDAAIDARLPELLKSLMDKAIKDGDRQAIIYLLDRRLGKIPDRSDEKNNDWLKLMTRLVDVKMAAEQVAPTEEKVES